MNIKANRKKYCTTSYQCEPGTLCFKHTTIDPSHQFSDYGNSGTCREHLLFTHYANQVTSGMPCDSHYDCITIGMDYCNKHNFCFGIDWENMEDPCLGDIDRGPGTGYPGGGDPDSIYYWPSEYHCENNVISKNNFLCNNHSDCNSMHRSTDDYYFEYTNNHSFCHQSLNSQTRLCKDIETDNLDSNRMSIRKRRLPNINNRIKSLDNLKSKHNIENEINYIKSGGRCAELGYKKQDLFSKGYVDIRDLIKLIDMYETPPRERERLYTPCELWSVAGWLNEGGIERFEKLLEKQVLGCSDINSNDYFCGLPENADICGDDFYIDNFTPGDIVTRTPDWLIKETGVSFCSSLSSRERDGTDIGCADTSAVDHHFGCFKKVSDLWPQNVCAVQDSAGNLQTDFYGYFDTENCDDYNFFGCYIHPFFGQSIDEYYDFDINDDTTWSDINEIDAYMFWYDNIHGDNPPYGWPDEGPIDDDGVNCVPFYFHLLSSPYWMYTYVPGNCDGDTCDGMFPVQTSNSPIDLYDSPPANCCGYNFYNCINSETNAPYLPGDYSGSCPNGYKCIDTSMPNNSGGIHKYNGMCMRMGTWEPNPVLNDPVSLLTVPSECTGCSENNIDDNTCCQFNYPTDWYGDYNEEFGNYDGPLQNGESTGLYVSLYVCNENTPELCSLDSDGDGIGDNWVSVGHTGPDWGDGGVATDSDPYKIPVLGLFSTDGSDEIKGLVPRFIHGPIYPRWLTPQNDPLMNDSTSFTAHNYYYNSYPSYNCDVGAMYNYDPEAYFYFYQMLTSGFVDDNGDGITDGSYIRGPGCLSYDGNQYDSIPGQICNETFVDGEGNVGCSNDDFAFGCSFGYLDLSTFECPVENQCPPNTALHGQCLGKVEESGSGYAQCGCGDYTCTDGSVCDPNGDPCGYICDDLENGIVECDPEVHSCNGECIPDYSQCVNDMPSYDGCDTDMLHCGGSCLFDNNYFTENPLLHYDGQCVPNQKNLGRIHWDEEDGTIEFAPDFPSGFEPNFISYNPPLLYQEARVTDLLYNYGGFTPQTLINDMQFENVCQVDGVYLTNVYNDRLNCLISESNDCCDAYNWNITGDEQLLDCENAENSNFNLCVFNVDFNPWLYMKLTSHDSTMLNVRNLEFDYSHYPVKNSNDELVYNFIDGIKTPDAGYETYEFKVYSPDDGAIYSAGCVDATSGTSIGTLDNPIPVVYSPNAPTTGCIDSNSCNYKCGISTMCNWDNSQEVCELNGWEDNGDGTFRDKYGTNHNTSEGCCCTYEEYCGCGAGPGMRYAFDLDDDGIACSGIGEKLVCPTEFTCYNGDILNICKDGKAWWVYDEPTSVITNCKSPSKHAYDPPCVVPPSFYGCFNNDGQISTSITCDIDGEDCGNGYTCRDSRIYGINWDSLFDNDGNYLYEYNDHYHIWTKYDTKLEWYQDKESDYNAVPMYKAFYCDHVHNNDGYPLIQCGLHRILENPITDGENWLNEELCTISGGNCTEIHYRTFVPAVQYDLVCSQNSQLCNTLGDHCEDYGICVDNPYYPHPPYDGTTLSNSYLIHGVNTESIYPFSVWTNIIGSDHLDSDSWTTDGDGIISEIDCDCPIVLPNNESPYDVCGNCGMGAQVEVCHEDNITCGDNALTWKGRKVCSETHSSCSDDEGCSGGETDLCNHRKFCNFYDGSILQGSINYIEIYTDNHFLDCACDCVLSDGNFVDPNVIDECGYCEEGLNQHLHGGELTCYPDYDGDGYAAAFNYGTNRCSHSVDNIPGCNDQYCDSSIQEVSDICDFTYGEGNWDNNTPVHIWTYEDCVEYTGDATCWNQAECETGINVCPQPDWLGPNCNEIDPLENIDSWMGEGGCDTPDGLISCNPENGNNDCDEGEYCAIIETNTVCVIISEFADTMEECPYPYVDSCGVCSISEDAISPYEDCQDPPQCFTGKVIDECGVCDGACLPDENGIFDCHGDYWPDGSPTCAGYRANLSDVEYMDYQQVGYASKADCSGEPGGIKQWDGYVNIHCGPYCIDLISSVVDGYHQQTYGMAMTMDANLCSCTWNELQQHCCEASDVGICGGCDDDSYPNTLKYFTDNDYDLIPDSQMVENQCPKRQNGSEMINDSLVANIKDSIGLFANDGAKLFDCCIPYFEGQTVSIQDREVLSHLLNPIFDEPLRLKLPIPSDTHTNIIVENLNSDSVCIEPTSYIKIDDEVMRVIHSEPVEGGYTSNIIQTSENNPFICLNVVERGLFETVPSDHDMGTDIIPHYQTVVSDLTPDSSIVQYYNYCLSFDPESNSENICPTFPRFTCNADNLLMYCEDNMGEQIDDGECHDPSTGESYEVGSDCDDGNGNSGTCQIAEDPYKQCGNLLDLPSCTTNYLDACGTCCNPDLEITTSNCTSVDDSGVTKACDCYNWGCPGDCQGIEPRGYYFNFAPASDGNEYITNLGFNSQSLVDDCDENPNNILCYPQIFFCPGNDAGEGADQIPLDAYGNPIFTTGFSGENDRFYCLNDTEADNYICKLNQGQHTEFNYCSDNQILDYLTQQHAVRCNPFVGDGNLDTNTGTYSCRNMSELLEDLPSLSNLIGDGGHYLTTPLCLHKGEYDMGIPDIMGRWEPWGSQSWDSTCAHLNGCPTEDDCVPVHYPYIVAPPITDISLDPESTVSGCYNFKFVYPNTSDFPDDSYPIEFLGNDFTMLFNYNSVSNGYCSDIKYYYDPSDIPNDDETPPPHDMEFLYPFYSYYTNQADCENAQDLQGNNYVWYHNNNMWIGENQLNENISSGRYFYNTQYYGPDESEQPDFTNPAFYFQPNLVIKRCIGPYNNPCINFDNEFGDQQNGEFWSLTGWSYPSGLWSQSYNAPSYFYTITNDMLQSAGITQEGIYLFEYSYPGFNLNSDYGSWQKGEIGNDQIIIEFKTYPTGCVEPETLAGVPYCNYNSELAEFPFVTDNCVSANRYRDDTDGDGSGCGDPYWICDDYQTQDSEIYHGTLIPHSTLGLCAISDPVWVDEMTGEFCDGVMSNPQWPWGGDGQNDQNQILIVDNNTISCNYEFDEAIDDQLIINVENMYDVPICAESDTGVPLTKEQLSATISAFNGDLSGEYSWIGFVGNKSDELNWTDINGCVYFDYDDGNIVRKWGGNCNIIEPGYNCPPDVEKISKLWYVKSSSSQNTWEFSHCTEDANCVHAGMQSSEEAKCICNRCVNQKFDYCSSIVPGSFCHMPPPIPESGPTEASFECNCPGDIDDCGACRHTTCGPWNQSNAYGQDNDPACSEVDEYPLHPDWNTTCTGCRDIHAENFQLNSRGEACNYIDSKPFACQNSPIFTCDNLGEECFDADGNPAYGTCIYDEYCCPSLAKYQSSATGFNYGLCWWDENLDQDILSEPGYIAWPTDKDDTGGECQNDTQCEAGYVCKGYLNMTSGLIQDGQCQKLRCQRCKHNCRGQGEYPTCTGNYTACDPTSIFQELGYQLNPDEYCSQIDSGSKCNNVCPGECKSSDGNISENVQIPCWSNTECELDKYDGIFDLGCQYTERSQSLNCCCQKPWGCTDRGYYGYTPSNYDPDLVYDCEGNHIKDCRFGFNNGIYNQDLSLSDKLIILSSGDFGFTIDTFPMETNWGYIKVRSTEDDCSFFLDSGDDFRFNGVEQVYSVMTFSDANQLEPDIQQPLVWEINDIHQYPYEFGQVEGNCPTFFIYFKVSYGGGHIDLSNFGTNNNINIYIEQFDTCNDSCCLPYEVPACTVGPPVTMEDENYEWQDPYGYAALNYFCWDPGQPDNDGTLSGRVNFPYRCRETIENPGKYWKLPNRSEDGGLVTVVPCTFENSQSACEENGWTGNEDDTTNCCCKYFRDCVTSNEEIDVSAHISDFWNDIHKAAHADNYQNEQIGISPNNMDTGIINGDKIGTNVDFCGVCYGGPLYELGGDDNYGCGCFKPPATMWYSDMDMDYHGCPPAATSEFDNPEEFENMYYSNSLFVSNAGNNVIINNSNQVPTGINVLNYRGTFDDWDEDGRPKYDISIPLKRCWKPNGERTSLYFSEVCIGEHASWKYCEKRPMLCDDGTSCEGADGFADDSMCESDSDVIQYQCSLQPWIECLGMNDLDTCGDVNGQSQVCQENPGYGNCHSYVCQESYFQQGANEIPDQFYGQCQELYCTNTGKSCTPLLNIIEDYQCFETSACVGNDGNIMITNGYIYPGCMDMPNPSDYCQSLDHEYAENSYCLSIGNRENTPNVCYPQGYYLDQNGQWPVFSINTSPGGIWPDVDSISTNFEDSCFRGEQGCWEGFEINPINCFCEYNNFWCDGTCKQLPQDYMNPDGGCIPRFGEGSLIENYCGLDSCSECMGDNYFRDEYPDDILLQWNWENAITAPFPTDNPNYDYGGISYTEGDDLYLNRNCMGDAFDCNCRCNGTAFIDDANVCTDPLYTDWYCTNGNPCSHFVLGKLSSQPDDYPYPQNNSLAVCNHIKQNILGNFCLASPGVVYDPSNCDTTNYGLGTWDSENTLEVCVNTDGIITGPCEDGECLHPEVCHTKTYKSEAHASDRWDTGILYGGFNFDCNCEPDRNDKYLIHLPGYGTGLYNCTDESETGTCSANPDKTTDTIQGWPHGRPQDANWDAKSNWVFNSGAPEPATIKPIKSIKTPMCFPDNSLDTNFINNYCNLPERGYQCAGQSIEDNNGLPYAVNITFNDMLGEALPGEYSEYDDILVCDICAPDLSNLETCDDGQCSGGGTCVDWPRYAWLDIDDDVHCGCTGGTTGVEPDWCLGCANLFDEHTGRIALDWSPNALIHNYDCTYLPTPQVNPTITGFRNDETGPYYNEKMLNFEDRHHYFPYDSNDGNTPAVVESVGIKWKASSEFSYPDIVNVFIPTIGETINLSNPNSAQVCEAFTPYWNWLTASNYVDGLSADCAWVAGSPQCYEIWDISCYFRCGGTCYNTVTGASTNVNTGSCGQCTFSSDCSDELASLCANLNSDGCGYSVPNPFCTGDPVVKYHWGVTVVKNGVWPAACKYQCGYDYDNCQNEGCVDPQDDPSDSTGCGMSGIQFIGTDGLIDNLPIGDEVYDPEHSQAITDIETMLNDGGNGGTWARRLNWQYQELYMDDGKDWGCSSGDVCRELGGPGMSWVSGCPKPKRLLSDTADFFRVYTSSSSGGVVQCDAGGHSNDWEDDVLTFSQYGYGNNLVNPSYDDLIKFIGGRNTSGHHSYNLQIAVGLMAEVDLPGVDNAWSPAMVTHFHIGDSPYAAGWNNWMTYTSGGQTYTVEHKSRPIINESQSRTLSTWLCSEPNDGAQWDCSGDTLWGFEGFGGDYYTYVEHVQDSGANPNDPMIIASTPLKDGAPYQAFGPYDCFNPADQGMGGSIICSYGGDGSFPKLVDAYPGLPSIYDSPDVPGYDFSEVESIAQDWALPGTDPTVDIVGCMVPLFKTEWATMGDADDHQVTIPLSSNDGGSVTKHGYQKLVGGILQEYDIDDDLSIDKPGFYTTYPEAYGLKNWYEWTDAKGQCGRLLRDLGKMQNFPDTIDRDIHIRNAYYPQSNLITEMNWKDGDWPFITDASGEFQNSCTGENSRTIRIKIHPDPNPEHLMWRIYKLEENTNDAFESNNNGYQAGDWEDCLITSCTNPDDGCHLHDYGTIAPRINSIWGFDDGPVEPRFFNQFTDSGGALDERVNSCDDKIYPSQAFGWGAGCWSLGNDDEWDCGYDSGAWWAFDNDTAIIRSEMDVVEDPFHKERRYDYNLGPGIYDIVFFSQSCSGLNRKGTISYWVDDPYTRVGKGKLPSSYDSTRDTVCDELVDRQKCYKTGPSGYGMGTFFKFNNSTGESGSCGCCNNNESDCSYDSCNCTWNCFDGSPGNEAYFWGDCCACDGIDADSACLELGNQFCGEWPWSSAGNQWGWIQIGVVQSDGHLAAGRGQNNGKCGTSGPDTSLDGGCVEVDWRVNSYNSGIHYDQAYIGGFYHNAIKDGPGGWELSRFSGTWGGGPNGRGCEVKVRVRVK